MEFAKKMILIPEDRMTRHTVNEELLSELDKEIKQILYSKQQISKTIYIPQLL